MAKWTFLKQFDMIESLHICQGVYLLYGIAFCFHIFAFNRCHILEMWQIHVSEISVLLSNTRCSELWTKQPQWVDLPIYFCSPPFF